MRLLFFILVLANVVTLTYFLYHEQRVAPVKVVHPPLNAERVRTVSAQMRDAKVNAATLSCWTWSLPQQDEIVSARTALDKLGLGERVTQNPQEVFVLVIDGLKTKGDAEKKLAELRALGIDEVQILEDVDKRSARLLLGSFADEDAATVRLNQLKEKGVKSTSLTKQAGPGARFVIKQTNEKTATELSKIAASFAGSELKSATCPAS